ncbi:MAG TPA: S8 family serine peptidase [Steroidobacteraceae bacterium]
MRRLALIVCLALVRPAGAQVGLPPVRLPQLPPVAVPSLPAALPANASGDVSVGELDPRRLRELRARRVRELLRRHQDVLEADPQGAPIVRGEVLALTPSPAAMQAAIAAGLSFKRELALSALDLRITVLHVPGATTRALQRLQEQDPSGVYDFNHIYLEAGAVGGTSSASGRAPSAEAADAGSNSGIKVGLIDSGVDEGHEVFRGLTLERHGCAKHAVPAAHGTAIASLLVGRAGAFHGAAPGAALYAADVFCGQPTGGSVEAVAEALAWLVEQRIPVINVSLVGPPDQLLERVVREALARGSLVVAAVGNDGPAAPPLYPAAWPGVIGVTGVDAHGRVLAEAERGTQVKFAAPGADMVAANVRGGYLHVRGTSFAAPIVAGLLALVLPSPDSQRATEAVAVLARSAQHPTSAAVDSAYGYGLVGGELRLQAGLGSARSD